MSWNSKTKEVSTHIQRWVKREIGLSCYFANLFSNLRVINDFGSILEWAAIKVTECLSVTIILPAPWSSATQKFEAESKLNRNKYELCIKLEEYTQ